MREIRFRAWDLELKQYRSAGTIQMSCGGKLFLLIPTHNNFSVEKIDKIVLEQFTGLKDKNGKDIYEGDILKREIKLHENDIPNVFYEKVGFNEASFSTVELNQKDKDPFTLANYTYHTQEVIGNIYENPELLSTPTAVL